MQRTTARDCKQPYLSNGRKQQESARNPSHSRKIKHKDINVRKTLLKNTLLESLHPAVDYKAAQFSQELHGAN